MVKVEVVHGALASGKTIYAKRRSERYAKHTPKELPYKTKSAKKRFYNSAAWCGVNGVRQRVIKRDKECVWCKREGLVTTIGMGTLEVDHIIELENCTEEDAVDMENLRLLCKFHHNLRHERFEGRETNKEKFVNEERW